MESLAPRYVQKDNRQEKMVYLDELPAVTECAPPTEEKERPLIFNYFTLQSMGTHTYLWWDREAGGHFCPAWVLSVQQARLHQQSSQPPYLSKLAEQWPDFLTS